jgi:hypothetical protein
VPLPHLKKESRRRLRLGSRKRGLMLGETLLDRSFSNSVSRDRMLEGSMRWQSCDVCSLAMGTKPSFL